MSQNNKAICSLLSSKSQSRLCKTSQPRGTINTQPTATFQHKCYCRMSQDLNVGVVLACCSPLSGTTLLFPVLKKFRISKNGYTAALIHQSKRCTAIQPLFVFMRSCQNYWHWQVDDPSCRTQKNTKCTAYSVALSIDTFVFSDTFTTTTTTIKSFKEAGPGRTLSNRGHLLPDLTNKSSIPGIHIVKWMNWQPQVFLCPQHVCCGVNDYTCTHMNIHTMNYWWINANTFKEPVAVSWVPGTKESEATNLFKKLKKTEKRRKGWGWCWMPFCMLHICAAFTAWGIKLFLSMARKN